MLTRVSSPTGITSRGPTADDAGFSLTAVPRDTMIATGSTEQSVVDDRNMTTHTTATVDREYNLQAAETIPGTFTPYLQFESLDPSIAEVDANGVVVRKINGTARMLAKTQQLNHRVDVAVSRSSTTTTTLDSFTVGSLARDVSTAIDSRLAGKTPSVAKPIFSTQNHGASIYVRNTGCWANGIDLTCVSPWNSASGPLIGMTAISALNGLTCRHGDSAFPIGTVIRFVAADGTVVPRTVTGVAPLVGGAGYTNDLTVVKWDVALPNTITPAKVLPANVLDYLPSLSSTYPLPCLAFDQEEKALVTDLHSLDGSLVQFQIPADPIRQGFYESLIAYDSGNPCFIIINGAAILVTVWSFGGAGAGPRIHALHTEINAAMTSLGGGYQLTDTDLSAYTDFS